MHDGEMHDPPNFYNSNVINIIYLNPILEFNLKSLG